MHTIGKNQELALKEVRAGTGQYYIPRPNSSMTCKQLQDYYQALNDQLMLWGERMAALKFKILSGDKKEAANITEIINIQSPLLGMYETEMQRCIIDSGGNGDGNGSGSGGNGGGSGSGSGGGTDPLPGTTSTGAGIMDWVQKNPLLVAGAGVAAVLFLRKKKISGAGDQLTWLLVAGGAILYYQAFKNTMQET